MQRPGYLNITEAALRYGVSRAKLHRLIKIGRLHATKDPRDERVTLLPLEELEGQFSFRPETLPRREAAVKADAAQHPAYKPGQITPEWRAQLDELRERISAQMGGKLDWDSVEIIREQREIRSKELYEAVFGEMKEDNEA